MNVPAGPLIPVTDLATLLDASDTGNRPALLDVRWALQGPPGRSEYDRGHLPGAVFFDLDTALAAPATPADGRHPLPDPGVLQQALRAAGVDDGDAVVVYDAGGGLSAARAWWLLRWAGLNDVRLLDGGLAARQAAGKPVQTTAPTTTPGRVTVRPGNMPVLSADQAAALPDSGVLLDARAGERYRGESEPIDPRAGHIPGAVSAPTTDNLDTEQHLLPAADLAERFAALGIRPGEPVGVYCGSGVTAAHQILALSAAGIDAALYPGSWSQWSADPDRPVATGPTPR